jgi:SHS2 domain-containing protein
MAHAMKTYQLIDHTADFGIQVAGEDLAALFTNAGLALFDLLSDATEREGADKQAVCVKGADWPDLMVNWLRELLYLYAGEEKLVRTIQVESLVEAEISATVTFDFFDPACHEIKNEIKAVTYHQISVDPTPHGWAARIIFDM